MMWGLSYVVIYIYIYIYKPTLKVYHCLYETTCALPFYLLVNGKIGRSKNNNKYHWEIGEEVSDYKKEEFYVLIFICV